MDSTEAIKFVVKDAERLVDVVQSISEGGGLLETGLSGRLAAIAPDRVFEVRVDGYEGLTSLNAEFQNGANLGEPSPDVVILSLAAEMSRLVGLASPDRDLAAVRSDLVDVIRHIRDVVGAHILVTNVSTVDGSEPVFTYQGVEEQPWTLRAHRLNLMLIGVSHDEGASIIDVDRVVADTGGDHSVIGPARYSETGCAAIVDEIVRVVEDYGFLDDRALMEQVGAGGQK